MSCTRAIYTRLHGEAPLPVTVSSEPDESSEPRTIHPALLGFGIAAALLAGFGLIVAGVMWGGWWRVGSAAATVAGIAAIVVPAVSKSKRNNGNGETK